MNNEQRDRRLLKEFQAMKEISSRHALFSFACDLLSEHEAIAYMRSGYNPRPVDDHYRYFLSPEDFEQRYPGRVPEQYLITYTCTGLAWFEGAAAPQRHSHHQMLVVYGWKFPSEQPIFIWLTPIWHPNIYRTRICLVDHHFATTVALADIVIEVGRLIQYQRYNLNNPLDLMATEWTHQNLHQLPIDERDLLSAQELPFTVRSKRKDGIDQPDDGESHIELL